MNTLVQIVSLLFYISEFTKKFSKEPLNLGRRQRLDAAKVWAWFNAEDINSNTLFNLNKYNLIPITYYIISYGLHQRLSIYVKLNVKLIGGSVVHKKN